MLVFRTKIGVNCSVSIEEIGFRGVSKGIARLVPYPSGEDQIYFFQGVDVPADQLPYLPDMGPGSDFKVRGAYWHHYQIIRGIFIGHIYLVEDGHSKETMLNWVLQAIWFKGEERSRVFLDNRNRLISEGLISDQEIQDIIAANNIKI